MTKLVTSISEKLGIAGMALSFICIIHCMSVPVLLALFPLVSAEFVSDPLIEFGLVGSGFLISGSVAIKDYLKHHRSLSILGTVFAGFIVMSAGLLLHGNWYEHLVMILGALLVAWGMYRNYNAYKISCASTDHSH